MKDYVKDGYIAGEQINLWHKIFFNNVDVKNKRVVDIGCAAGMFSREVVNKGGECIAIDLNPNLKEVVEKKGIKFLSGTLENNYEAVIEFKPDIIVALEVIEHLYDPYPLVLKSKDVFKQIGNKGEIYLSTPNFFSISRAIDFILFQRHRDPLYDVVALGNDAEHVRGYSHGMVVKLLENCGFKVSNRDILSRSIPFLYKYFSKGIIVRGRT